jgi:hypothetical protein
MSAAESAAIDGSSYTARVDQMLTKNALQIVQLWQKNKDQGPGAIIAEEIQDVDDLFHLEFMTLFAVSKRFVKGHVRGAVADYLKQRDIPVVLLMNTAEPGHLIAYPAALSEKAKHATEVTSTS